MLNVFMTRWLREGVCLGECYIISGGGSVVLLYDVIWWRRAVKNGHFLVI